MTPTIGDLIDHGSQTHNGHRNVCRVVRTDCAPSDGFLAIFVDPRDTRKKRVPTDRPFFVWRRESTIMRPYTGAPEMVEQMPDQLCILVAPTQTLDNERSNTCPTPPTPT